MRPQVGRDKILDAALTLFANQGYHATSISQIAHAAQVSKGLTYNYFDSKEALLLAIINRASDAMVDVAGDMGANAGYQIALRDFLARYGRSLKTGKNYLSFQLSLLFQPDLKDIVLPPLRERAEQLLALATAMFRKAGAAEPHRTARRFISELDGIAMHYISVFEDYPLDDMLIQLYENYKDIGR